MAPAEGVKMAKKSLGKKLLLIDPVVFEDLVNRAKAKRRSTGHASASVSARLTAGEGKMRRALTGDSGRNADRRRLMFNTGLGEYMAASRMRQYTTPTIAKRLPPIPEIPSTGQINADPDESDVTDSDESDYEDAQDGDESDDVIVLKEMLDEMIPAVTTRQRAKTLLKYITSSKSGGSIQWNPTSYHVIINGVEIQRSNIVDLLRYAVKKAEPLPGRDKSRPPPGFREFARALTPLNPPRNIIQNRRRWADIYGEDSDTDMADTPVKRTKINRAAATPPSSQSKKWLK